MAESLDKQVARLTKKLRKIKSVEVPRAGSATLNKSGRKITTRVVAGVAKQERIPQKLIRKKTHLRKSTVKTQKARFKIYRAAISAISLMRSQTIANNVGRGTNRKGVRAGGRQFNGAFINATPSGQLHVFRRLTAKRLPLEVVRIPVKAAIDSITPRVSERVMRNEYPKLLKHELEYRLKKYESRT